MKGGKKWDSSGERSVLEGSVVGSGDRQDEAQSRHGNTGDSEGFSPGHLEIGMQCVCWGEGICFPKVISSPHKIFSDGRTTGKHFHRYHSHGKATWKLQRKAKEK